MRRQIGLGMVVAGVALLLGCAQQRAAKTAEPEVAAPTTPASLVQTPDVQGHLTRTGLFGPDVAVRRTQDELRGRLYDETIVLDWSDGQIRGQVGAEPTLLRWRPEPPAGVFVEGSYQGLPTRLVVTDSGIRGTIGECNYWMSLAWADTQHLTYRGTRDCGGPAAEATVVLPRELRDWPYGERAAWLSLVLGSPGAQGLGGAGTGGAGMPRR